MATKVDEWIEKVETRLIQLFPNPKFQSLKLLLQECGAVISGGSILKFIVDSHWSNDLDIYCPVQNIPKLLNGLIDMNKDIPEIEFINEVQSSIYCRSFLRKNGIRKVYTFKNSVLPMDVMSVRKNRTVQEVCSNFDLTCVQVWYDGQSIFATHPEHIRERKAFLQSDYVIAFLRQNRFLKQRYSKYIERQFKIEIDPEFQFDMNSINRDLNSQYSIHFSPGNECERDLKSDEFWKRWFNRTRLRWISKYDYETKNIEYIPQHPMTKNSRNQIFARATEELDLINDAEGYESEDIEETNFEELSYTLNEHIHNNELSSPSEIKKAWYWRLMNKLYYWATVYDKKLPVENTYNTPIKNYNDIYSTEYLVFLQNNCVRKGTGYLLYDEDVHIYDIHKHPLEAGISREGLEGYLESHIRDVDKTAIPCYYKPNPSGTIGNCTKPLSLYDIQMIVSPEFFERFNKPVAVKAGLDQIIPFYDSILTNTKSVDPLGFGNIFHHSMCPFCLQFESRSEGCAYLTHENPKMLDTSASPFCLDSFLVKDIIEKYSKYAREDSSFDGVLHLEFCAECGAPCNRHQHFDMKNPGKYIPSIRRGRNFDYGVCPGGGRRELVARVLAVRDIFKESTPTNMAGERLRAALAAENAATDPSYLERADAILAAEPDKRKFNTEVPKTKIYTNSIEEDSKEPERDTSDSKENEELNINERLTLELVDIQERLNEFRARDPANIYPHDFQEIDELQDRANEIRRILNNQNGGRKRRTYKKRKQNNSFTRKN